MLPVFDLSEFLNGDDSGRRVFAQAMGAACEDVGFFYVKNHGVSAAVVESAYDAARAFFGLPRQEKMACERPQGRYRGYIPPSDFVEVADGRPPILYEAFLTGIDVAPDDPAVAASHGLLTPNIWPNEPSGFQQAVSTYQQGVHGVGMAVMHALALTLTEGNDAAGEFDVDVLFARSLSNISLLHYLPRPDTGDPNPDDARAHYDTNALTVLLPSLVGGLEVLRTDGAWMEVPPLDGCFVVNIGNMMQSWSGGRFKSTMHRVHPPLGQDRYSIGYFLVPEYDVVIKPVNPEKMAAPEFCAPVHAGQDLARFVASIDAMKPAAATT